MATPLTGQWSGGGAGGAWIPLEYLYGGHPQARNQPSDRWGRSFCQIVDPFTSPLFSISLHFHPFPSPLSLRLFCPPHSAFLRSRAHPLPPLTSFFILTSPSPSLGPMKSSYRGSGGALWTPPAGSGAEPQPKSNFVHFCLKIWPLLATCDDFLENQITEFHGEFPNVIHAVKTSRLSHWVRRNDFNFIACSILSPAKLCGP